MFSIQRSIASSVGSSSGSSRSIDTIGSVASSDTDDYTRHPLNDEWSLWYLQNDRTKSWEDMQTKVTSFRTVEDFWCLHNHVLGPSGLGDMNDYSLFKNNIRPMWEDIANKYGGRWVLTLGRHQRRSDLDSMWLDTILYVIGGTSRHSEEINGIVVNVRSRGDKISLWTADCHNKSAINGIGNEFKKYLGTDARIVYEMHNANSKSSKPLVVL
ncbi:Eukaryotic translation initiation factor 4E1 [Pseudolycoriella hygida]|uniref:eIF-4F 25 kDa subunit n=1 Tax=Pseudolycoriella hygida TaxID=35572 RepID=A0A9Q0N0I1_9DIPT|nr:Eukaryotic translation initiation factor 4E1 [Pseudolycoriella hygida]